MGHMLSPSSPFLRPSRGSSALQGLFTSMAEEVLGLRPGIICLTGGGGKTTLMYELGTSLARLGNKGRGARVLLTTTTRIKRPSVQEHPHCLICGSHEEIRLPEEPCALTAARPAGPGQNPEYLRGFDKEAMDALWQKGAADWIIVEADGSAGRPLKAPSDKEPVIPSLTAAVIAVAGLSGIYRMFTDSQVFRPVFFSALTGLRPGDVLLPEAVASVFSYPDGLFKNSPETASRLAFFNQADIPGGLEAGIDMARAVLQKTGTALHGVYAGSARQPSVPCLRFHLKANYF